MSEQQPLHQGLAAHSKFEPKTPLAARILKTGILAESEKPAQMVERMVKAIYSVESRWGTPLSESQAHMDKLTSYLDGGYAVMGSPVMTNAGKNNEPLTSCYVPSAALRSDLKEIKKEAYNAGAAGMGAGFDFSDVEDPTEALKRLNQFTIESQADYTHGRSIGNMATISVRHPKLLEFIQIKDSSERAEWRFNLSVNVDDAFMQAVVDNADIELADGQKTNAKALYDTMIRSAWRTGEPGLIFMDRLNQDNPTPKVGMYTSVAPCAEVGLAPGETCQFGYVNVGKCVTYDDSGKASLDINLVGDIAATMTRTLDDAVEYNIDHALTPESAAIARLKRKIGIGMYGLADLLARMELKYDSPEARQVAQDVMAVINFSSKVASVELAKTRGSFGAMNDPEYGSAYDEEPSYLVRKYAGHDTTYIHPGDWMRLNEIVQNEAAGPGRKLLRNASTTALPPTGKSAVIGDGSYSIEPYFSHFIGYGDEERMNPVIADVVDRTVPDNDTYNRVINGIYRDRRMLKGEVPDHIADAFDTALELSIAGHLDMVVALQQFNDEAISKTINLRHDCLPEDVGLVYIEAWKRGLKGVTIYRDQSRTAQPQKLSES